MHNSGVFEENADLVLAFSRSAFSTKTASRGTSRRLVVSRFL